MKTIGKLVLTVLAIVIAALLGAVTQDANARTTGGGYGWKATGKPANPTTHPTSHHQKKGRPGATVERRRGLMPLNI